MNTSKPCYDAARALLVVRVEGIPLAFLRTAIQELHELMGPIAAANQTFLAMITPVLQQTSDPALLGMGVAPVRMGLAMISLEATLKQKIAALGSLDETDVQDAARAAQIWGWMAFELRDSAQYLRDFILATSEAGPPALSTAQRAS